MSVHSEKVHAENNHLSSRNRNATETQKKCNSDIQQKNLGKNTKMNPLLDYSTLLHGAFPFNLLKKEHYQPALDAAIADAKTRLDIIRKSTSAATFENTIVALETSGEKMGRVTSIFYNMLHANSDDDIQAMAREFSPKLAEFSSDILLDPIIFSRVKSVYETEKKKIDNNDPQALNPEQWRLTEKSYRDFARNGALLDEAKKTKLREIDQELARVAPLFSENVLKAQNAFKLVVEHKEDLAGLPESAIEAAALAATESGNDDQWLFNLQVPSYLPLVTYADHRELREKIWRGYNSRSYGGEFDNQEILKSIARLRHQRADVLGYPTHAQFVLEERMAESPSKVTSFLKNMLAKIKPAAERDLAQVRSLMKETTGQDDLMPWDYAYFSEKLKLKLHDFDQEQLRPYFKLESTVDGVFEHARRLFGLKFRLAPEIPVYHQDVKVFEVSDETSGRFIGLFYADFFPRPSKQNGAWATSFREQGLQFGEIARPHVSIVCNFTKPTSTKPSLLTLEEVQTLFHEFGHALHGLLSECTYVSLAGTNVYWDFVELPSQIMENWVLEKEALDLFAKHYETGATIPIELTEKIRKTARFQAGWSAMRQINFALLDMAWHGQDPTGITDIAEFEKQVTNETSLLPRIPEANYSTSFSHIFAGGYSAGYYSYKWAEVLDADAFELFKEKGLYNREVATSLRDNILSRGGTENPMTLYKKFRGREPDPDALLRRDGLL
jgi:peptidyl-dipeptidase Dcp